MATFTSWTNRGYTSKFHNTPFSATPLYTMCGRRPDVTEDTVRVTISDRWSPTAFQWNVGEGNMCKKCYQLYLETKQV